jgi:hypothetical protein
MGHAVGRRGRQPDRPPDDGQKVTDFISVGVFPVFNVADASITVGVVVLLLGVWMKELKEKKKAAEKTPEEQVLDNKDQFSVSSE